MTTIQLTVDTLNKTIRATKDGSDIQDLSSVNCDSWINFDGDTVKMLEVRTRSDDENGVTHMVSMFWTWTVDGSGNASATEYIEKEHALPFGTNPNQARKALIATMLKR